jgi:hypothetical protein
MMSTFEELGEYADPEISKRPHARLLLDALRENKPRRWNRWRRRHAGIRPDLRGAVFRGRFLCFLDLSNCRLEEADLGRTDLRDVDLSNASLNGANLALSNLAGAKCEGADFSGTSLYGAYLSSARLAGARFHHADLSWATLVGADLSNASLVSAFLEGARLDRAVLSGTVLRGCKLDHASFVDSRLEGTQILNCSAPYVNAKRIRVGQNVVQRRLFLGHTIRAVPGGLFSRVIQTDDLRVASFLGELEKPDALSHLINAGTDYLVLILGRFDHESRIVLEALERNVWSRGRIPLVFDFQGPRQRSLVDAVRIFACLAEFVIADLTEPRSVAFELSALVPELAIPLVPLIKEGDPPFAMFADLRRKYPWVLPVFSYRTTKQIDRHFDGVLELVFAVQKAIAGRFREVGPMVVPISGASRLVTTLADGKTAITAKRRTRRRQRT